MFQSNMKWLSFYVINWILSGFQISNSVCCHTNDYQNRTTAKRKSELDDTMSCHQLIITISIFYKNQSFIWKRTFYTGGPSVRWEEIIYVNETYANVTLAFKRCCVTKMPFTRVCMGTLRVCFKYLKSNVLWIKLTNFALLSYSLLFHGVWGHFEAFSAS